MSQLPSASPFDSDPLLGFETEQKAPSESPELVVKTRISADLAGRSAPADSLSGRVSALEKSLAASTAEVALLRSDVATLVRTVDDIRTRNRKPGGASTLRPTGVRRTASIALLIVAVVAGAWLWMSKRASAESIVPTQEQHSTVPNDTVPHQGR